MLSNYVTSVIRTVVPVVVGAVIAVLAKKGINVDEAEVSSWLIPTVISAYYSVARLAEIRFPRLGWLLGVPKAPGYAPGSPPKTSPGTNPDL